MDAAAHTDDLATFISSSPSSFHAADTLRVRLTAAGFTELDETEAWPSTPGRYLVVRAGAVIAWVLPSSATAVMPFRIVGAHTDSPGFVLKPNPTVSAHGWLQAGVEVYGGPILASWFDRELEFAGRVTTADGTEHLVRTGPYLRIPHLAIHLDRTVNTALTIDRQRHTGPVYGLGDAEHGDLLRMLARRAGVDEIIGYDLVTADTQAPARFGLDDELFAAGRMDDLTSVHAGLVAILAAPDDAAQITMLAAFDHEEVGSGSPSGARGPFLSDVIDRIGGILGARTEDRARAFASSWHLSADVGHSVHPNHPEKHDPANRPVAGGGPLLKLNADLHYASDAVGTALFARCCAEADVPYQPFVSNNAVPCGTTIGPLAATRLGIRTVDVGIPILSMHSARELAHVADPVRLSAAMTAFYRGA